MTGVDCEKCIEHPKVRESLINVKKDLSFIQKKMDSHCAMIETVKASLDVRLKVKPFYVLISILVTVLMFMLGAQWQLFNRVDDVLHSIDKTRYELYSEIMETKGDIREYQDQVNLIKQRVEKLAK
jgi:hypothetical protein